MNNLFIIAAKREYLLIKLELQEFRASCYPKQQSPATFVLPLKDLRSPHNCNHQEKLEFNAVIFYHFQSFQAQYDKVNL